FTSQVKVPNISSVQILFISNNQSLCVKKHEVFTLCFGFGQCRLGNPLDGVLRPVPHHASPQQDPHGGHHTCHHCLCPVRLVPQLVGQIRGMFNNGTKVCMAIGGWGDNVGFSKAALTDESRKEFAKNVAATVDRLGYDCVDMDWEFPGGNGQDYKQNPNSGRVSEIETFPLLLQDIKAAIGTKELSIAVPGKEVDMIAYTAEQVPKINAAVDFINVMAYDLMNRRDNVTLP
ncbi:hypothetical protein PoMZ_08125, partial [Pyricularia oryzae]